MTGTEKETLSRCMSSPWRRPRERSSPPRARCPWRTFRPQGSRPKLAHEWPRWDVMVVIGSHAKIAASMAVEEPSIAAPDVAPKDISSLEKQPVAHSSLPLPSPLIVNEQPIVFKAVEILGPNDYRRWFRRACQLIEFFLKRAPTLQLIRPDPGHPHRPLRHLAF